MAEENKEQEEHTEEQEKDKQSADTGDTSSSDDKNETSEQVDDKDKDKEGDETQTDENEQSDNEADEDKKPVPYSRFKEVNDKYKAVKQELDELKNGQSNQDDSQENEGSPADNGELEHYKTAFNEVYQSKLESVPEEYKDLIPEGDELSKFRWIESAINKGLFSVKAESFGNTGNNPGEQEEQDSTSFIRDLGRKF